MPVADGGRERSLSPLAEVERSLTRVTTPEERRRFRERVAGRAGLTLSPGATWALVRIHEHGAARAREFAEQHGIPAERIAAVAAELSSRGLVDREDPSRLTDRGREHSDRLLSTRCDVLAAALADNGAAPSAGARVAAPARARAVWRAAACADGGCQ
jgi:DNA-binding MarR family transcriptional regulator